MGENKKRVNIVGHKNPDTDSVCSAIAYAYLKNQTDPTKEYVPKRAGKVSAETQFVLDTFGFDAPGYLDNIGTRVKDMEMRRVTPISTGISIKDAWNMLMSQKVYTLPITNEERELQGLITINDIARSYMEEQDCYMLGKTKTTFRNIVETLEGELIVGDMDDIFENGKIIVAAMNPDVMEKYIDPGDMVILGNRYEAQLCAIEMEAKCIVICLGAEVSKTIRILAREHGCTIIVTPLDTFAVSRLINQSMPVDYFMMKKDLVSFHERDYTDTIKDVMSKLRHRDFPILDKRDHYVGMISRRNLLGVRKRQVILVDHNEIAQAVDNIMDADVMEVIDHHRLGTLETVNPIYFRNQPVGCTSTILFEMYQERKVEIPKAYAGLMCAAILSDTLCFRSPTCTSVDKFAANRLAEIAGIECEEFAKRMFTAGGALKGLTAEEILYRDFKKFEIGEQIFGIGQITSMSEEDLEDVKQRLLTYYERVAGETEMDVLVFLLTNILEESSDIICVGENDAKLMKEAFGADLVDHVVKVPGVVSRKKQVVPALINAVDRMSEKEDAV